MPLADEDDPLSEHFDDEKGNTDNAGHDVQENNKITPRIINIGGKATIWVGKGDRLVIETPGGGGWGVPEDEQLEGTAKLGAGAKNIADAASDIGKKVVEEVKQTADWAIRGSLAERAAVQAGV